MPLHSGSLRRKVIHGGLAGIAGTVVMTVPIVISQRIGLFATPPPMEISENIARRTWLLPERSNPAFPFVWLGAHFGYGAGCGITYPWIRPFLY